MKEDCISRKQGTRPGKTIAEPKAYVYIVECADGTLYTGWTLDVKRRVEQHNAGAGSRYTAMRRPVRLVYRERCACRSSAMHRERAIKGRSRAWKLRLVARYQQGPDGRGPD